LLLRPYLAATNLAMVYLLGVVAVATRCSRSASVMASFLSVGAFDFFCVPPYLTFQVSEYEYLITFAGMLVVALVISAQTSRIRAQALRAVDRESRTKALYRLSRRLSTTTRVFDAALAAAEQEVTAAREAVEAALEEPRVERDAVGFERGPDAGHDRVDAVAALPHQPEQPRQRPRAHDLDSAQNEQSDSGDSGDGQLKLAVQRVCHRHANAA